MVNQYNPSKEADIKAYALLRTYAEWVYTALVGVFSTEEKAHKYADTHPINPNSEYKILVCEVDALEESDE